MANKTIPMLYIRRIIQLKQSGISNRRIAKMLGIDRKTVNDYSCRMKQFDQNLSSLQELDDGPLASLLCQQSESSIKDSKRIYFDEHLPSFIERLGSRKMTRMVLWEDYRKDSPQGYGYSQFCELLSRSLMHNKAVLTHDHAPADALYFDFAGDYVEYVDSNTGEVIKCPVFIAVLPYSNYIYADVLPSQKRDQTLSAMNRMLHYFGGVPRSCKSDNMAQYVIKSNRYEPVFEELVQQWSFHNATSLLATRVAKPRDKASVESAVNTVYNRIYSIVGKQTSLSLEELRMKFRVALESLNDRPMQKHGRSRKDVFLTEEKALLGKLPDTDFVQKFSTTVKVQRNYHITITAEKQSYSVPYHYIGKDVKVIYDTDHVEIYLNHARIALHKRSYRRGCYSTDPAHMPPAHVHVRGWNEEFFIVSATEVGPNTVAAIQHILSQKVFIEQSYKSCLGSLRLQHKFGKSRLEAACGRALTGPKINYTILHDILKRGLDQAIQTELFTALPQHENLRGAHSYVI